MKEVKHLYSIFLGILNVYSAVGVVPYITDNSSENLSIEGGNWSGPRNSRESEWVKGAFNYVRNLKCEDVFFTTEKECQDLLTIPQSSIVVYVAPYSGHRTYEAVLPDETLTRKDNNHQGVLVLDPYPTANFGHLVIVFFIDNKDQTTCDSENGIFLGTHSDCMTLALKRRCKNAMKRHGRKKHHARRCEINFLPFVYLADPSNSKNEDKKINYLRCWQGLSDFARCPKLRDESETKDLICNPLRDNTKRCTTTHEMVKTNCNIFEICDQGVLISGGWNRQTTGERYKKNLEDFYWMLRENGFKKNNIKTFYANGATGINVPGELAHHVHPAALKLALRYHIQTLCRSPHCVNSLVLYLNSPAKNDGTMFLWDVNSNGLAEDDEKYFLKEFKEDISNCAADYVQVIIDQSFSGNIADAFKNSPEHRNVVVFSSGKDNEYAFDDEFTHHWVTANHTQECTWQVQKQIKNVSTKSNPESHEGQRGEVRATIFGAPCHVIPPFSNRELRHEYLGCQSLPTALWIKKLLADKSNQWFFQ